jgi:hypothetical protein
MKILIGMHGQSQPKLSDKIKRISFFNKKASIVRNETSCTFIAIFNDYYLKKLVKNQDGLTKHAKFFGAIQVLRAPMT